VAVCVWIFLYSNKSVKMAEHTAVPDTPKITN